jgi:hypothetical protein
MTQRNEVLTVGLAALLAAAVLPGTLVAQESNARPQGAEAAASDGQQHTQRAIARALHIAIDGGDLQLAAQAARGGRLQDMQRRNAENRRDNDANADNRRDNAAANADNRRDNAAANADNRRDNADNQRDNTADNQQRQQANQQVVQQLQRQARQEFETSNRLLSAADEDLRGQDGGAASRPEDRSAWSRRLHTAANQYVQTLQALSGVQAGRSDASNSVGGQANQQNDRANAGGRPGQDQNAEAGRLNRTDAARVVLVNHAVRQALQAFEINQWTQAVGSQRAAVQGASAQRIQEHARQLASESRQILQSIQAGANRPDGGADDRRDNAGAGQRNDAAGNQEAAGQYGQASVQMLAQQAQQVVDTLQRISGAGEAQRGQGADNR